MKIKLGAIGGSGFTCGWEREVKAEPLSQTLATFGRETFEVIVHENPDTARIGKMPLDLERPAFESSFAFPKQPGITMNVFAVAFVFRRVIAEQSQIKKIGRARQKFERREIAFVQRGGIGPDPADAMFFQKMNDLGTMPGWMTKLDRETKILR